MNDIEIADLYQELIVDHSRRPRNYRRMENPTHQAEGFNPLCGDKVKVYVDLENDIVRDVSFEGDGCAISRASASLMTESIKGKSKAEAEIDRKSTRLNSSHTVISYAVFCLKKKKLLTDSLTH